MDKCTVLTAKMEGPFLGLESALAQTENTVVALFLDETTPALIRKPNL